MKNNHSSSTDSLKYTKFCTKKKRHAPSFSKICTLHENWSKQTLRNLPEFKPKTENFQEKLHQEECKQSKGAKICTIVIRELECEKCSKTLSKIFARQNMQNQPNENHSFNSEDIFKSTKNVLEKRGSKEDSSNITISNVLGKICNRKNFHSNDTTFTWLKVL